MYKLSMYIPPTNDIDTMVLGISSLVLLKDKAASRGSLKSGIGSWGSINRDILTHGATWGSASGIWNSEDGNWSSESGTWSSEYDSWNSGSGSWGTSSSGNGSLDTWGSGNDGTWSSWGSGTVTPCEDIWTNVKCQRKKSFGKCNTNLKTKKKLAKFVPRQSLGYSRLF